MFKCNGQVSCVNYNGGYCDSVYEPEDCEHSCKEEAGSKTMNQDLCTDVIEPLMKDFRNHCNREGLK